MSLNPLAEEPLEELVRRTEGLQHWRRLFHLVGGSFVALIVYSLSPQSASVRWLFGSMLVVAFLGDLLRLRFRGLNRLVFRTFGPLMCPREANRPSITWYLLGIFLVLWAPGEGLAVPSLLVLALADPAAGVAGRFWGKHPLGKGTLEGSAAFFFVAVVSLVPFVDPFSALAAATAATAAEAVPTPMDDNLVIPVVTAGALWALSGGL